MGARYDRLGLCFFGVDLEYGDMDLRQGHTITCFLIVDHSDDEVFVRKQALQLLMANCDWFHIYGKQEPLWHRVIDEMDIVSHPYPDNETIATTAGYDNIDDFVNEIDICIHARTLIPNDVFLLYDDVTIYKDVLRRLSERKQSGGENGTGDDSQAIG